MKPDETIFALSSGSPPAAIAIVRISGPCADRALGQLAGRLPEPRLATLVTLEAAGLKLDEALVLRFPGPASSTGEDVVELHLHGGRAVVAAVLGVLGAMDGLRPAEPGEFTRRAFDNGRIDLSEAEGLADLLAAETQSQRRAALAMAGGAVSRMVAGWQERLLGLSAALEAAIDFSDEGEVGEALPAGWKADLASLVDDIDEVLARPPAERLRDGIRIVLAGPPNAGKSSLFNALAGRDAAITSALPGTTRDLVEAPTSIGGTPFLLIDTAGLRDWVDEIEAIGVSRAEASIEGADLILWLGRPELCPDRSRSIVVASKSDLREAPVEGADINLSAATGENVDMLTSILIERAKRLLPGDGEISVNSRHRGLLHAATQHLATAEGETDFLLLAEAVRQARARLDSITGNAGV
ncbi:MAG: tRNA uridine-5-carboxymethylaminomethyl(34) synthesis GTPase MnmE, partial [Allosphingosinicella sp.]